MRHRSVHVGATPLTQQELQAVIRGIAPVLRECVAEEVAGLAKRLAEIEQQKAIPGPQGDTGVGISSLVISADKRLLAHLSDGKSIDTGPVPEHELDQAEIAQIVEAEVARRMASLPVPKDGKDGEPGKDADASAILELKSELAAIRFDVKGLDAKVMVAADISALVKSEVEKQTPQPWTPDPEFMQGLIADTATKAAELVPAGKDGKDGSGVTVEDFAPLVKTEVAMAVAAIPIPKDGEPGQSVPREDVLAMVKAAVDEIPRPENGRSVTVEDVAPLIETAVKSAVDALPRAKDGVSVVDALVDRDGQLIQTFSDGRTKSVGTVVGRDVDMAYVLQRIDEAVANLPKPKDGRDGSLEGVKMAQLDDETVQFQRADGTPIEGGTFRLPGFYDKGVWKEGESYRKGYAVSFGGSVFIAQRDTTSKPETDDSWRLAVKRGRDGRNGKDVAAVPGPVRLHG